MSEAIARTAARGTFEVRLQPLPMEGVAGDALLGRMTIDKQFHGDLEGTSQGEMLTAGTATAGSAAYVAVERVTGRLGGKQGTFALHHTGLMNRGQASLSIGIVPDSGTGGLAGISGSLSIRVENGAHFYTLEYAIA